ncbi:MAG: type I methionyl aminopeptidase [Oscillospiraceae bacterium]
MISLKNQTQLSLMRKAGEITALALHGTGEAIKPGISTAELDRICEQIIRKAGARPTFKGYGGFPAAACISINDEVIHGIPSKKRIVKEGDIVSIDVGAFINGFTGDSAFTFPCGVISPDAQRLLSVTQKSLEAGIAAAIPGNRIGDIGFAVQSVVESFGFSVVRDFVGHGVGAELHEEPEVPNFGTAGHGVRLTPGMTIAIEPMVNVGGFEVRVLSNDWTVVTCDNSLSAHFEHSIAITKSGPVILTALV